MTAALTTLECGMLTLCVEPLAVYSSTVAAVLRDLERRGLVTLTYPEAHEVFLPDAVAPFFTALVTPAGQRAWDAAHDAGRIEAFL